MGKVILFLRLFRWPNLLMILLIQILFKWAIADPVFVRQGWPLPMEWPVYTLLIMATLAISAAGYAINDYFDLRADRINKPEKVLLVRGLSRRAAILSHQLLNAFALLLAFYLSWHLRSWWFFVPFLFIQAALWFYSLRFKHLLLLGNLLIGLLTAMVILVPCLAISLAAGRLEGLDGSVLWDFQRLGLAYGLFAFLMTLPRELAKDAEDLEGDLAAGGRTYPVVMGPRRTRQLMALLLLLVMVLLAVFQWDLFLSGRSWPAWYLLLCVQLPLPWLVYLSLTARTKARFRALQRGIKWVMLLGIFSMVLFIF